MSPPRTLFSSSCSAASGESRNPPASPPFLPDLDDLQGVDYPERQKGQERSRGPRGDDEAGTVTFAVVAAVLPLPPLPTEQAPSRELLRLRRQPGLARRDPGESIGMLPRGHRLDRAVVVLAAGPDLVLLFGREGRKRKEREGEKEKKREGRKREKEERERKKTRDLSVLVLSFLPFPDISYLERVIVVKVPAGPGPRGRVDRLVRVVGPF